MIAPSGTPADVQASRPNSSSPHRAVAEGGREKELARWPRVHFCAPLRLTHKAARQQGAWRGPKHSSLGAHFLTALVVGSSASARHVARRALEAPGARFEWGPLLSSSAIVITYFQAHCALRRTIGRAISAGGVRGRINANRLLARPSDPLHYGQPRQGAVLRPVRPSLGARYQVAPKRNRLDRFVSLAEALL